MGHESPIRRQWWRKILHGAAPVVASPAARALVKPLPLMTAAVRTEAHNGRVKLSMYSRIRKLRRAINRGVVSDDRQVIIDTAIATAARRAHVYRNAHARRAAR